MQRVVITGAGAITALGLDAPSTWAAMRAGRSAITRRQRLVDAGLRVTVAAEVDGFDPKLHFDDKRLDWLDPVAQFALVAAREAVRTAGLGSERIVLGERAAAIFGCGIGGEHSRDAASRRLYAEGNPRLQPLTIVRVMANAPASHAAIEFGIKGPSFVVSSACASANHAIGQALAMVRAGTVDLALTGGTEAFITLGGMRSWEAMRVLADDTCRPFCLERRGLVAGEGAAVFVIESLAQARRRGAPILAELAGAGMTSDAADMVMPSEDGAARAMRAALDDAGLTAADIGYINAHGTGTSANDVTETRAIRRAFGPHAERLFVTSTKAVHGHALGAAGAIELLAVLGALRESVIPPTANFGSADPACDLNYAPNTPVQGVDVRTALSNSFAFGGMNAVLAVRRWEA